MGLRSNNEMNLLRVERVAFLSEILNNHTSVCQILEIDIIGNQMVSHGLQQLTIVVSYLLQIVTT